MVVLFALLISIPAFAQEVPAPKLVWERSIDLPSVEREDPVDGSAFGVLQMVARPDGGVVIAAVEGRKGRTNTLEALRIIAVDGTGKDQWTRKIAVPGGHNGNARMTRAAIDASDTGRVWVFQAWQTRDDVDQGVSRLVALSHTGGMVAAVANGARRFGKPGDTIARHASKLMRLSDGSLLAIGTHYHAPPQWWYARYDKTGKMLWERGAKSFPDHVHDAWPLPDGGAALLMMDAEGGPERPAVRRISADGRTLEHHVLADLEQFHSCAELTGPRSQVRALEDIDWKARKTRKSEIVWHEIGRGIVRRLDMGEVRCESIVRNGTSVVYVGTPGNVVLALTPDGTVRWRQSLDGSLTVAALADGGAIVLREIEEKDKPPRLILTRYAAP